MFEIRALKRMSWEFGICARILGLGLRLLREFQFYEFVLGQPHLLRDARVLTSEKEDRKKERDF